MLRAMAAATKPAPPGPATTVERGDRRPLAGGNLRGGQDVLDGRIGGHEEHADDKQSADERDGQAALGAAHFAGHHGQVVPPVIGPERGDKGEHEAAEAAGRVRQRCGEVRPRTGGRSKAEARRR